MAAVTSLTNPVNIGQYILFFNDANNQLASKLQYKNDPSTHAYDYNTSADPQVPPGPVLDPSSLAVVLLSNAICAYGVIKGAKSDMLICRLSPGFQKLDTGDSVPLANPYSIAACSDSEDLGFLFYLVSDDGTPSIYSIQLPGITNTSQYVPFAINLNPKTYIASVYGKLGEGNPTFFLAAQGEPNHDGRIYIYNGESQQSKPVVGGKGVRNSPIAMLFHGTSLVIYFFGPIGSGQQPDTSPLCRAVAKDFDAGFNYTLLDNAPAPSAYTQLTAVSNPSGSSLGSIILTYVQNSSNQLVSWNDTMDGFNNPPDKE